MIFVSLFWFPLCSLSTPKLLIVTNHLKVAPTLEFFLLFFCFIYWNFHKNKNINFYVDSCLYLLRSSFVFQAFQKIFFTLQTFTFKQKVSAENIIFVDHLLRI